MISTELFKSIEAAAHIAIHLPNPEQYIIDYAFYFAAPKEELEALQVCITYLRLKKQL